MDSSPHSEIAHTLIALAIVAVLALSGMLTFVLGKWLRSGLPYLVAAAAGALLGIAFAHLLPDAAQQTGTGFQLGLLLTVGFLGSFLLERLLSSFSRDGRASSSAEVIGKHQITFHHSHEHPASGRPLAANILFGGAIHSFIDGVAIATAFAVSHNTGVAATLAVLLHEVPHHIADVGVLIYGGLSKMKAVLWNALAGCSCLLGGVLVLLLGDHVSNLISILLPITAANFLYIAGAVLLPELQREQDKWRSAKQTVCLVGGVALMFGLSQLISD